MKQHPNTVHASIFLEDPRIQAERMDDQDVFTLVVRITTEGGPCRMFLSERCARALAVGILTELERQPQEVER